MNELNKNFEMVRIEKCKTTDAVNKCEKEHNRKDEYAIRPNVNQELTSSNIIMSNFKHSQMEIFEHQKELYNKTHKKKLRKDAVKALDGVLIVSDIDKVKDLEAFKKSCTDFMTEYFKGCPMRIWIHKDEKSLHAHFMVCPINKEGECITDSIMRKPVFRGMQTRFAQILNENGMKDVVRGLSKSERFEKGLPQNYHKSNWKYAQERQQQEEELKQNFQEKSEKFQKEFEEKKKPEIEQKVMEDFNNRLENFINSGYYKQKIEYEKKKKIKEAVEEYAQTPEFDIEVSEKISERISKEADAILDPTQKSTGAKGEEEKIENSIYDDFFIQ